MLINFAIKDFDNFDVKHVHDHVNLFSVIRDYFPLMVVLVCYLNKIEFALQSCGALVFLPAQNSPDSDKRAQVRLSPGKPGLDPPPPEICIK